MAPQVGHLPFFPAAPGGVRTVLEHRGHGNSIRPRFAAAFAWPVAAADWPSFPVGSRGVDRSGICTTTPQFGHFPFFPAVEAGVRTGNRQWGQENSILSAGTGTVRFFFGEAAGFAELRFGVCASLLMIPEGIAVGF